MDISPASVVSEINSVLKTSSSASIRALASGLILLTTRFLGFFGFAMVLFSPTVSCVTLCHGTTRSR